MAATKSRSTCSASPLRSRPWSTKTQVSRSPIARCTTAAATAESTPPESPQMARPESPIWLADALDLLLDDVDHRPGRPAAGDVEQEVLEHLLAVLGVHHLGVPLDPGQAALDVLERCDRGGHRGGEDVEALGCLLDRVAVRHPHPVLPREVGEQGAGAGHADRRTPELRDARAGDLAAQLQRHRLEAVAHAEDRDPGLEQVPVDGRSARRVDRRGAAGEHDRRRLAGQHLLDRHGVRDDLGVDLGLAHPAGDQLGVLGSEVDDEDEVVVGQVGPFQRGLEVCPESARNFP